jgi:hypothetical protein
VTNRPLRIAIVLLLVMAIVGLAGYVALSPLPEPIAAVLFTPTPTATSTATPTPTSTPTPTATPTPTPEPLSVELRLEPAELVQGGTLAIAVQPRGDPDGDSGRAATGLRRVGS